MSLPIPSSILHSRGVEVLRSEDGKLGGNHSLSWQSLWGLMLIFEDYVHGDLLWHYMI